MHPMDAALREKARATSYEFRAVNADDLDRERTVDNFHLGSPRRTGKKKGWVPDMRIEPGDKTEDEPIRTRGWQHTGTTSLDPVPIAGGLD